MVILLGLTTIAIGKELVIALLFHPGMTVISTIKAVMPIMDVTPINVKMKSHHQWWRMIYPSLIGLIVITTQAIQSHVVIILEAILIAT